MKTLEIKRREEKLRNEKLINLAMRAVQNGSMQNLEDLRDMASGDTKTKIQGLINLATGIYNKIEEGM